MTPTTPDTTRRDCRHPSTPHHHGTRRAYLADRCRCTRCRVANRAAERRRTTRAALGLPALVDVEPIRDHLLRCRQAGLGIDRLAVLSGVPRGTIRRLLSRPPRQLRAGTARRLQTIPITSDYADPRSHIDARRTRHQLAQLTAAGHRIDHLARALGKTPASLRRTQQRQRITIHTATAVERLAVQLRSHGKDRPMLNAAQLHQAPRATSPAGTAEKESANSENSYGLLGVSARFLQSVPLGLRLMGHRPGPGRKSKGDRDNFAVKPMRPVGNVIRANADRLGMTYGEYCAAILSNALGMAEYAPQPPDPTTQQEFPLKSA